MLTVNKLLLGAGLLFATQSLAACVMGMEEDGSLALEEEGASASASASIDQRAQELGESTCTSWWVNLNQPDGAKVTFQYPRCSYATSSATSIDNSYDQSLCPDQFVTEVREVNDRPFTAFVEAVPDSAPSSESECEGIAVYGKAWGHNGSSWVDLGSIDFAGTWHPASCGPIFCLPAYCDLSESIVSASGYDKVRVAGWSAALFLFKGRVETGVTGGPGPC